MTIRKIENGYVTTDKHGYETYYPDAQALFDGLLMAFESKSSSFNGESYGRVFVATLPTEFLGNNEASRADPIPTPNPPAARTGPVVNERCKFAST
jgi:hypothetical protein